MLNWEYLKGNKSVSRAKVPGGWFIFVREGGHGESTGGGFFYPDPEHAWDGTSLP